VTQYGVVVSLPLPMGQQKLAAGIALTGIVSAARMMPMDLEMKKVGVGQLQNPLILLWTWRVADVAIPY
jgi:tetrahydromethanopterin S-methyltransferase subunit D